MSKYVHTPNVVTLQDVVNKDFTLSSSQYVNLVMPNKNYKYVREFLSRPLLREDLGVEVGSLSYIDKSPFRFIRTKALQSHSFLPELNKETALPILPSEFVQMNLKEGDLLISKDSNIGEIVILDKDYPDCMLSGAIYKLPVKSDWRYYLLAFIKSDIFREQLDFMVPKGATIRHAKTMFLDCKIPLPNKNVAKIVRYISVLTKAIINKEKLIRQRHADILQLIEKELTENQKPNKFNYHLPRFNEVKEVGRLDTGIYGDTFLRQKHLLTNYKYDYCNFLSLNNNNVVISRGQNLQESNIGKSIYTNNQIKGYYTLCLSKHFTQCQTITQFLYLGNKLSLKTINEGEIIFSCRGEMGRLLIFCDQVEKTITNIDNVHIEFPNQDLFKNIYIAQILSYLKEKGFIKSIAITGSGADSFTKYQFDMLPIPNFPESKQKEIAALYHNPQEYFTDDFTLDNFEGNDNEYNLTAGIYELDKTAKRLKEKLNKAIDDIVNDKDVQIEF